MNFNLKSKKTIFSVLMILSVIVIVYCSVYNNKTTQKENFVSDGPGVGKSFGAYHTPQTQCDNCFPGSYLRSEIYQNVCDNCGKLRRNKISSHFDGCLRKL